MQILDNRPNGIYLLKNKGIVKLLT